MSFWIGLGILTVSGLLLPDQPRYNRLLCIPIAVIFLWGLIYFAFSALITARDGVALGRLAMLAVLVAALPLLSLPAVRRSRLVSGVLGAASLVSLLWEVI